MKFIAVYTRAVAHYWRQERTVIGLENKDSLLEMVEKYYFLN
jgi:hypothetical protein